MTHAERWAIEPSILRTPRRPHTCGASQSSQGAHLRSGALLSRQEARLWICAVSPLSSSPDHRRGVACKGRRHQQVDIQAQARQVAHPQFHLAAAGWGVNVEAVEEHRAGSAPPQSACGAGGTGRRQASEATRRSQERSTNKLP